MLHNVSGEYSVLLQFKYRFLYFFEQKFYFYCRWKQAFLKEVEGNYVKILVKME